MRKKLNLPVLIALIFISGVTISCNEGGGSDAAKQDLGKTVVNDTARKDITPSEEKLQICNIKDGIEGGALKEHPLNYTANHFGDPGWNYIYDQSDYKKFRANIISYVDENGKSLFLPNEYDEYMDMKSLDVLYSKIMADVEYKDNAASGHAFAAVRLYYGFDPTRKIILLFKPCVLLNNEDKPNSKSSWRIKELEDVYYITGENNATLVSCPNPQTYQDAYIPSNTPSTSKNVFYKNGRSNERLSVKDWKHPDIVKNDVTSCIIPLQEILYVYLKAQAKYAGHNVTGVTSLDDPILDCKLAKGGDILSFSFVAGSFHSGATGFKRTHTLHVVVFPTNNNKVTEAPDEGADFGGMNPPYSTTIDIKNYEIGN